MKEIPASREVYLAELERLRTCVRDGEEALL